MSSLRWPVRGHGIYACGCLFPSLLLDEKGPKNQGRHQGPYTHGNRPSPMSAGPARPTQSVFGVPIHSERSSHVIPALACVLARNLWLRHLEICPSYYENPTLHIGVWWGRPFRTLMLYPSFSWNDNALAPCRHGGQGSAISYALGTHSCRRFASSRGGTTKRSIYDRLM